MAAKLSEAEFEKKVVELAEQGLTSEQIGLELKKEGVLKAKKQFNKRISQVLKEKALYTNPDIKNMKSQIEKLKKHTTKNKTDYSSKRALLIQEARLRKLEKIEAR